MQYRQDKYGNRISILGYGCLRFSQKAGRLDQDKAEQEILAAIEGGVNFFDTAYVYTGSEALLGNILHKNGLRSQVYIATKLPHYLIKSVDTMERMFQEQLRRLKTDRIDYYLMHMLNDRDTWQRLLDMGIGQWLRDKVTAGTIGQVGFSYHGNTDMFCRLVDAWDWDFCQIQYNYMDEHSQAGRRGLQYAHSKGLPVIVMEPLRGGKLVNMLPESALKLFKAHPSRQTPAQWAFNWLWDQKEVTCVLSGMNSLDMVKENTATASQAQVGQLTDADREMLHSVARAINEKMKVGCTGCGYCVPCPRNVDIPGTFAAYNHLYTEGTFHGLKEYFMCTAARKTSTAASNCIGCGKCEQHCPQHIPIRQELKNAQKALEVPVYTLARKLVSWLKLY